MLLQVVGEIHNHEFSVGFVGLRNAAHDVWNISRLDSTFGKPFDQAFYTLTDPVSDDGATKFGGCIAETVAEIAVAVDVVQ
jgi:hypothetical protein